MLNIHNISMFNDAFKFFLLIIQIIFCLLTLLIPIPQVCMLLDIFRGTDIMNKWTTTFLALPIFVSSAINPWVYGYRNSEVRAAVQRVLEELLGRLGFESPQYSCPDLLMVNAHHDHAELNSFASHVRLCAVSPMRCTELLIPTNGRTETSDVTSHRDIAEQEMFQEVHTVNDSVPAT